MNTQYINYINTGRLLNSLSLKEQLAIFGDGALNVLQHQNKNHNTNSGVASTYNPKRQTYSSNNHTCSGVKRR